MEDNKQEDVDVLFVIRTIKNGFTGIARSIGWLIDFSIKKFFSLLVFIIIGGGIGFGLFMLKRPYYKSELTVSHIRFENDYCAEMINNLSSDIHDQSDNTGLAEKLNIDIKTAHEIKSIAYKPFNPNIAKLYNDSVSVLLPFKVEVEVYNNEALPVLQTGILNYLESNEYATKLKEIQKQALDRIEQRLKTEIVEIDSLKHIVNQSILPRSTGNGIILGEAIEPVLVYKRAMESYEKLMAVNKKQSLNNSFQLMIGFTKNNMVAGCGKMWHVVMGILFGYIAGLIVLNRKKQA